MAAYLLDVNVLVALAVPEHVHSAAAHRWYSRLGDDDMVATCPITQLGLVRFVVRSGAGWGDAAAFLQDLGRERHELWPDDLDVEEVPGAAVAGHRQVTDAYLASLARSRGGRVATLDQGLAQAHRGAAALLPV